MSTLETLEKWTHAWSQDRRETLGRLFGIAWTERRYQRTGSLEGLEFLYPFLNDSDAHVRRHALDAAVTIFRGAGAEGLDKLAYITRNRDRLIRDRAAPVVGSALSGEPLRVVLEVLSPFYTHKSHFIRALGCLALGLAGEGKGWKDLLPIFAERIGDSNTFVAQKAVEGLSLAFKGSGDPEATVLLEPFVAFPVVEAREGESGRDRHFRWRRGQICHSAAGEALACIGQGTEARRRAADLIRQYLHPHVPDGMDFERQLTQRHGVWALTRLLRGEARQALADVRFLLARPGPGEPAWARRIPRSATIWDLAEAFAGSGAKGAEAARSLLAEEGHAALRTGMLCLGIAAQGSGDEDAQSLLEPFLTHPNGALRDSANLAVGFAFQGSSRPEIFRALQDSNLKDRRGASTNYPLGVGLLFQGSAEERVAAHLSEMFQIGRRRLAYHAGLGIGMIYQGTSSAQAVERMLPLLETDGIGYGCEALLMVDFSAEELAAVSRRYPLADGPGAAQMFVLKHFVGLPGRDEAGLP